MGFKDVRQEAIRALEEGRVQHEARDEVDEKNLLLTGEVNSEQVVRLLRACRGNQYNRAPHHVAREIDVHVFKPQARLEPKGDRKRWYIKLYFLEPDVWFIVLEQEGVTA